MLLHKIDIKNILSFGPDGMGLEMTPLTVLIGPNGAGKSNLIEVLSLLKTLPKDTDDELHRLSGTEHWMWQGSSRPSTAEVSIGLEGIEPASPSLVYSLTLAEQSSLGVPVMGVSAEHVSADNDEETVYASRNPSAVVLKGDGEGDEGVRPGEYGLSPGVSILSGIKQPRRYPEIMHLGESLSGIRLYREWTFGRNAPLRVPQRADFPKRHLHEDSSNLALTLNRIARDVRARRRLVALLRELYGGLQDLHIDVTHGRLMVYIQEDDVNMPATRLSDGTLRYLHLLAILCDPSPPPVVCLEEPELGLHPDVLPELVTLMQEVSERCQLIVTTHSEMIVDALTETPESVVVCEKHNGQTTMRRLCKSDLQHWLDKYRLGDLWSSGHIGGNRW